MINEELEVKLPDGTKLLAKTERNGENPGIFLFHVNAQNDLDEVAFAEYNPSKPFGQKLENGAYRNEDDDCKYNDSFCYCIKPSFVEMLELYEENPNSNYIWMRQDGYDIIRRELDDTIVYRDFSYENIPCHEKHDIKIIFNEKKDMLCKVSFVCKNCGEAEIYTAFDEKNIPVQQADVQEIKGKEFSGVIKCITDTLRYKNPPTGYLDYVENECWRLFKLYAEFVGAEIGDGIDFSIVKELSEKFMAMVEKTFGIAFPVRKQR